MIPVAATVMGQESGRRLLTEIFVCAVVLTDAIMEGV